MVPVPAVVLVIAVSPTVIFVLRAYRADITEFVWVIVPSETTTVLGAALLEHEL